MRIVFVHGINNQGKSSAKIVDEWLGALAHTVPPSDMAKIKACEIVAPYYGDILHDATVAKTEAGAAPVAQGVAGASTEEAEFYSDALSEMAPAAGVREHDVRAEETAPEPLEQGFPHNRRLLAVARALEVVSPLQGRLILRFLPQAFVYLRRKHVENAIDDVVAPYLSQNGIVVAHSLGTVISFKRFRRDGSPQVPLLITLGSPLAVRAVQNSIGPAFGRQECTARWQNFVDPNDAVTIGRCRVRILPSGTA